MHHHYHLFNSDLITFFPLLMLNSWYELEVCDLENFWTYKPDTFNCFHHCKPHNEQNLSLLFPTSQLTCRHLTLSVSDLQTDQLHLALGKWSVIVYYWGIAKSAWFWFFFQKSCCIILLLLCVHFILSTDKPQIQRKVRTQQWRLLAN